MHLPPPPLAARAAALAAPLPAGAVWQTSDSLLPTPPAPPLRRARTRPRWTPLMRSHRRTADSPHISPYKKLRIDRQRHPEASSRLYSRRPRQHNGPGSRPAPAFARGPEPAACTPRARRATRLDSPALVARVLCMAGQRRLAVARRSLDPVVRAGAGAAQAGAALRRVAAGGGAGRRRQVARTAWRLPARLPGKGPGPLQRLICRRLPPLINTSTRDCLNWAAAGSGVAAHPHAHTSCCRCGRFEGRH